LRWALDIPATPDLTRGNHPYVVLSGRGQLGVGLRGADWSALDLATGQPQEKRNPFRLEFCADGPWLFTYGSAPPGRGPGDRSQLAASERTTGRQLWRASLYGEYEDATERRVVAQDGRVVWVGQDGFLRAADAATGRLLWRRGRVGWMQPVGGGDSAWMTGDKRTFARYRHGSKPPTDVAPAMFPVGTAPGRVFLYGTEKEPAQEGQFLSVMDLTSGALLAEGCFTSDIGVASGIRDFVWCPRHHLAIFVEYHEWCGGRNYYLRALHENVRHAWSWNHSTGQRIEGFDEVEGINHFALTGDLVVGTVAYGPFAYGSCEVAGVDAGTGRTVWRRRLVPKQAGELEWVGTWKNTAVVSYLLSSSGVDLHHVICGVEPQTGRTVWSLSPGYCREVHLVDGYLVLLLGGEGNRAGRIEVYG
jgi:hypothetical protein